MDGACGQLRLEYFMSLCGVARFLAVQTAGSPRHGGQAFGRDRLFAIEADSKLAIVDALQRRADLRQILRLTLERARGELPFTRELDGLDLFIRLHDPQFLAVGRLAGDGVAL